MPMNSALFVDTSGWASYLDADEPTHQQAMRIVANCLLQGRHILTTSGVLSELVALIASGRVRISHAEMVTAITMIKTEPGIRVEFVDQATDEQAWQLIVARPDKHWSQVDASSFIIMNRLGMLEALTSDHHFTQAGFTRLPLP